MKSLILSVFAAIASFSAFASDEPLLVCEGVPVPGIEKIVIVKNGEEFHLIETQDVFGAEKGASFVTTVFTLNLKDFLARGALLSEYNGYTRKLVRHGRNSYTVFSSDDCSTSITTLSCKENISIE